MTSYVALLRGVNLGKRQLKMDDLRRIAAGLGLEDAKTYIASGNLLFRSGKAEKALKVELEAAIATRVPRLIVLACFLSNFDRFAVTPMHHLTIVVSSATLDGGG